MQTVGSMLVDRASGGDPGVAKVILFGPRGGYVGEVFISRRDAEDAVTRLCVFGDVEPRK